ncbi:MAG: hypothetical protein JW969_20380, partial [Spirochaetales bacterium]|nr:hypothetical protein [Spirochaetales bacterium]
INPGSSPVYNFFLTPTSMAGLTTKKISGNLPHAVAGSAQVTLYVANTDGGGGVYSQSYDAGATSYSIDTYTFGSDCFIGLNYNESSNPTIVQYYEHQDLSSDLDLDITALPTETVTINGGTDDNYVCDLSLNPYADVFNYMWGSLTKVQSRDMEVFNPSDLPVTLINYVIDANVPVSQYSTYKMNYSSVTAFSDNLTLPDAPDSVTSPVSPVNQNSVEYDSATKTISFDPVSNSSMYMLDLQISGIHYGFIFSSTASITFPESFYNHVVYGTSGWEIAFRPMWCSKSLDQLIDMRLIPGRPIEEDNLQLNYVLGTGDVNEYIADLIP